MDYMRVISTGGRILVRHESKSTGEKADALRMRS